MITEIILWLFHTCAYTQTYMQAHSVLHAHKNIHTQAHIFRHRCTYMHTQTQKKLSAYEIVKGGEGLRRGRRKKNKIQQKRKNA